MGGHCCGRGGGRGGVGRVSLWCGRGGGVGAFSSSSSSSWPSSSLLRSPSLPSSIAVAPGRPAVVGEVATDGMGVDAEVFNAVAAPPTAAAGGGDSAGGGGGGGATAPSFPRQWSGLRHPVVPRIFGVDGVDGSGVPTLLLVRLLLHSLSPLSQRDLLREAKIHAPSMFS